MFEYMCFFKANIRTSFLSNFDSPSVCEGQKEHNVIIVCECVCVCERERQNILCVCVCETEHIVCVCVCVTSLSRALGHDKGFQENGQTTESKSP